MSTENDNNPVDIDTDDLNDFEADFYQTKPEAVVEDDDAEEQVEENEADEESEVDDLGEDEVDTPATDEDDAEDEPEEEEPEEDEPKGKKNRKSAQERINELTAKAREAERREQALLRRLEEIEASVKKEVKEEEKAPTLREQLPADAPNPDAVDDKGEPIYPLGEFDPTYIRDLTKYTIEVETKAAKEKAAEEARQQAVETERQAIADAWVEKLDKVEEEIPEIRDNIKTLTDTFQTIEPAYGEYLATLIMASEYGPQVMNYLSQNIGEAQEIVASGPAAATLRLGRLEAQFIRSAQKEEIKRTKKVSKAAEPPESGTRGKGGKFATPDDTDDLEAFERKFFKP